MKITDMKNKVKICLEYNKKILGFGMIAKGDLEQLSLRVFLNDGTEISDKEIKQITFRLKEVSE